ncbi:hypothetical protein HK103_000682 [Boothiomyces macroporosus]|uniref:BHLH domain-containing protein n=1 Tax=Boothiomyces macroporosus TaxID=261099 RepID=A0AAD5UBQ4_9FUNG|nr:hypothetical protein HK103_000682 [Boothiomyces macroporosus]
MGGVLFDAHAQKNQKPSACETLKIKDRFSIAEKYKYQDNCLIHNYKMHPQMKGKTKEERKEIRKQNHSVIERKRRDRINFCLDQLKTLVPSCSSQQKSNIQKLAVLEQTVAYIMSLHNRLDIENNVDMLPPSPPASDIVWEPASPAASEESINPMAITNLLC